MRLIRIALATLVGAGAAAPASALTVLVYTNPMTLERKTVVLETSGPDRAYHCMLPPSTVGCQPLPMRRERR